MNTLRRAMHPILAALVLLTLSPLAHADTPPGMGAQRVYLGDGRTLTVSAPKQLTFNVRVTEALIRPGSHDVAYCGTEATSDTITEFVRLVNMESGKSTTLQEARIPRFPPKDNDRYELHGWSNDGRFLMALHRKLSPGPLPDSVTLDCTYDVVDMTASPPAMRRIVLPDWTKAHMDTSGPATWSPSGKKAALAFDVRPARPASTGTHAPSVADTPAPSAVIYDTLTGQTRTITHPYGFETVGWVDDNSLLLIPYVGIPSFAVQYDIRTGAETSTMKGAATIHGHPTAYIVDHPPAFPGATLMVAPGPLSHAAITALETAINTGQMPPDDVHTAGVWLRIAQTGSATHRVLLGVKLGARPTWAALAPDGSAALWETNGDLYACTFAVVPATDADKARS